MRKVLLMTQPPVTTYPEIANILSLLWDRKERIIPWFSDHFVQLVVRPDNPYTYGDYYDHADLDNYFSIIYGMSGLGWMRNNIETMPCERFTDYAEFAINNGYGLQACLDRYYISFTENYLKDHIYHATFIYGYDNEKREMYAADFWNGGRYEHITISYDEINASMNNDGIINMFKSYDAEYEIDLKLMKRYFEDYYYSRDSFGLYAASNKDYNRTAIFGLAYYDYVLSLAEKSKAEDYLDIRLFHLLYDHKVLMQIRMDYLKSLALFDDVKMEELIKETNEILDLTLKLRNKVIKFNYNHSAKTLENINSMLNELKKADTDFTAEVLAILKDI